MSKYLSEEYIINLLDSYLADSRGAEHFAYNVIKLDALAAPGIEIKHGHWIENGGIIRCSVCGESFFDIYIDDGEKWVPAHRRNYCSNCGTKMDEVNYES